MFTVFIFIFIIYIYIKMLPILNNQDLNSNTLSTLFKVQNFHDIKTNTSTPGITLISANSHGENYLFAKKNNLAHFSIIDINKIYEHAQRLHIHNIIILPTVYDSFTNIMLEKLKEYDIQVWDNNKVNSLISSPSTHSVLTTSNTSDDTCKIDTNQFNPIQEPNSFWKNLFKKPDRL